MTPLRIQIRTLRQSKKWSQDELAEQAGVSRITITRLERGTAKAISLDVLDRIARALDVAPGALIERDGGDPPPAKRKRGRKG
jgi:transcriptional regulator with XRE-family HTH domain